MVNLNEQQIKNLKIFLSRISLSGAEVPAFNELMAVLNPPVPTVKKAPGG